jgi:hypothetical protein
MALIVYPRLIFLNAKAVPEVLSQYVEYAKKIVTGEKVG